MRWGQTSSKEIGCVIFAENVSFIKNTALIKNSKLFTILHTKDNLFS